MWQAIKRFFGYHEIVAGVTFDNGETYAAYIPFEGDYDAFTDEQVEAHLRHVLANSPHGKIVSVSRYGMY